MSLASVSLSENIKILGMFLDSKLSFNSHISNLSKSCFYHILALRHIRPTLTDDDVIKTIACSLVCCRLDDATSCFLVRQQKTSDGFIEFKALWCESLHNKMDESVSQRRWKNYTGFLLSTASTSSWQPSYLSSIINIDAPCCALRSSANTRRLAVLQSKTKIGLRTFRYSAPSIWNNLPVDIRNVLSVQSFKSRVKTYYFRHAFN